MQDKDPRLVIAEMAQRIENLEAEVAQLKIDNARLARIADNLINEREGTNRASS